MELLEYPATDSQSSIVDPCILIPPGATVVDNVKTFFSKHELFTCSLAKKKKKKTIVAVVIHAAFGHT